MNELYKSLLTQFPITNYESQKAELCFISVPAENLVSLLTHLRDLRGYKHLVMLTCVDWIEVQQFQLTYILHNYDNHTDIGIKVFIDRDNAVMESIHHLWKQARVYQRELHEMFGIDFPGSPGLEIPMILEGWQGPPPMRRDFDTKAYCEETYSNRPRDSKEPEAYMKQKMYPED